MPRNCFAVLGHAVSNTFRTKVLIYILKPHQARRVVQEYYQARKTVTASNRTILFIGILLVGIGGSAQRATAQTTEASATSAAELVEKFRAKVVNLDELDQEVVEHLRKTGGDRSPGYVIADLNGDQKDDLAMLTKEANGKQLTLRLFLCDTACRQVARRRLGEFYGIQYLTRVAPGESVTQTEAIDRPSPATPAKLARTAIRYNVFGKAHVVYFWDSKSRRIREVTTGD
jgi:hypothetical protein